MCRGPGAGGRTPFSHGVCERREVEEASLTGVLRTRREWSRRGWESQRSLSKGTLGPCLDPKKALNRESSKGCEGGGKQSGGHF